MSSPLIHSGLSGRAAPGWAHSTLGIREEKQARASDPVRVIDPQTRPSGVTSRAMRVESREGQYGVEAIHRAHLEECIIREATNKYTDLTSKEGFEFATKDQAALAFIQERLLWIARSRDPMESFAATVKETARDYISQGNAFWVKVYAKQDQKLTIGGKDLKPFVRPGFKGTRGVLLGFFRADPRTVRPKYDKRTGRHNGWLQTAYEQKDKTFALDEVIHFAYQRPAGEVLGVSMYRPVLDDVRALRDQEEYATKLMEKMLFPILHHMVPARGDDQYGLAEDVDQAAFSHQTISPDGILVTPPGHELKMIGAAGEALDPVPSLKYMMQRAFMGAGVSSTIMGTEDSSAGTSDVLTTQIHNRVKSFQQDIEEVTNLQLILELLVEAGFHPTAVAMRFNEIEHEARIREENHAGQMYTIGLWTETEGRMLSQKNPLSATERKNMQVNVVQIPLMKAEAGINTDATKETAEHGLDLDKALATHQHKLGKDAAEHSNNLSKDSLTHSAKTQTDLVKAGVAPDAKQQVTLAKIGSQTTVHKASTPKPVVRKSSTSNRNASAGAAAAGANKNNPSNQYGSRGAARASATPAAGKASQRKAQSEK